MVDGVNLILNVNFPIPFLIISLFFVQGFYALSKLTLSFPGGKSMI